MDASGSARDPATIRRDGNRLKDEASLYLRQHAHNPVDWNPWGHEALERARDLDRPIFLSVGYASCHWCHVMEREAFDDDAIAAFLNAHFVCIKVDREERPDVDAVYMDAVQVMTGSGGWPMSVFLTPDLRPFFGGTYYPKEPFRALLDRIAAFWDTRRQDAVDQGDRVREAIAGFMAGVDEAPIDAATVQAAVDEAVLAFDPAWGGLGGRMKFPQTPLLDLLLHRHRAAGCARILDPLRRTLDAMASGGIRDHVGGGFHRYTVEPTWTVPHFEKMLYDNAQLARLYAEASVALDQPRYGEVARDTLDFLLRDMTGTDGLFYASFDADSGGEEGTYYLWTPTQLRQIAGERDGDDLARILGITESGNFEGRSIPTRRAEERPGDEELWARWRPALQAARAVRTPPGLDRKVVLAWNAMTVTALVEAGGVLGERRFLEAAARTADRLWDVHRDPDGRLMRASNDGVATGIGVVEDHAWLGMALLALHGATGEARFLHRALEVATRARDRFRRPEGAYYLTPDDHQAPLDRRVDAYDNATPSGNGAMARLLARLATVTGDPAWAGERDDLLRSLSGLATRSALGAPWILDAAAMRGDLVDVVIAGDPADPAAMALAAVVGRLDPSWAVLAWVPPDGAAPDLVKRAPALEGRVAIQCRPTAYLCREGACRAPTSDPEVLAEMLREGEARTV
jgi:uncharacterized protein YyaL (SSP411 family)